MARYLVRSLQPVDFEPLMTLENEVFGAAGEAVLGAYYLRLCTDFLSDACFVAYDGPRAVGYVLCFLKGREGYCTTLATHPDYQGSRVTFRLIQALAQHVMPKVDKLWFTVKIDNTAARAVHKLLGAEEVGMKYDYYGPGDHRLVSEIHVSASERLQTRYRRFGFAAPNNEAEAGGVHHATVAA